MTVPQTRVHQRAAPRPARRHIEASMAARQAAYRHRSLAWAEAARDHRADNPRGNRLRSITDAPHLLDAEIDRTRGDSRERAESRGVESARERRRGRSRISQTSSY